MSETEYILVEQSLKALEEMTGFEALLVSSEPRMGDDGARPYALLRDGPRRRAAAGVRSPKQS
jgi:hypothetical protein